MTPLLDAYGVPLLLFLAVTLVVAAVLLGAVSLVRRRRGNRGSRGTKLLTALIIVLALGAGLVAGGTRLMQQAGGLQRGTGPAFTLTETENRFDRQVDVDFGPFGQLLAAVGKERRQEMKERLGNRDLVDRHRVRLEHGYTASDMLAYHVWRMQDGDRPNSYYRAVLELDPRAIAAAEQAGAPDPDNPLHGAVVLVKGNVAVEGLPNDSGSWALADAVAGEDADVVKQLRSRGAVIAGRTNLSEFANFLSYKAPNGFSGRGGQALSPLGPLTVDPLGSSTGSATAVALDYADLTVGTETSGSVISPAQANKVVGLKAAHSDCSIRGIVPIDDRVDSVGFFGRSLRDVRLGHDAACPPAEQPGRPARVMVMGEISPQLRDRAREAGVELVEVPENIRDLYDRLQGTESESVLLAGAGPSMERHLADSAGAARTLGDIIDYFRAHPDTAPFGYRVFRDAQEMDARDRADGDAQLGKIRQLAAEIDAALRAAGVDALVTEGESLDALALAGVPRVVVPGAEVTLEVTAAREDALPQVLAIAEALDPRGTDGTLGDMSWMFVRTPELVPTEQALPGRDTPILAHPRPHAVLGTPITGPWREGQRSLIVGIGCFWGVEKMYWELDGVEGTSVGYAGGVSPHPTYREVCSGRTNHTEVVEVVYDPGKVSLDELVALALENHDPTQGMRQGNDVGTQYRSAIYTTGPEAREEAERVQAIVDRYAADLRKEGFGEVTTEVKPLADTPSGAYFLAEDEHQQYLHKVPHGYCPHHSTGVACRLPD